MSLTLAVSGDRNYKNVALVWQALTGLHKKYDCLMHGDCPTGADLMCKVIARGLGYEIIPFPADWDKYGLAAGPIRNQEMVDAKPDALLWFHGYIKGSKGTKDCIVRAEAARIRVVQAENWKELL